VPDGHGPVVVPQTHLPLTQLSANFGSQLKHVPPAGPQKLALVPGWHAPLASQQPLEQLVASQIHAPPLHRVPEGHDPEELPHTHLPFIQLSVWLGEQVIQAPPAVPQAVIDGDWHVPLAQQPVGQIVASQTQAPLTQWLPIVHGPLVFPQTHVPLTQLLVRRGSQLKQVPPAVPQKLVLVPGWQAPLASQQPLGQLVASQIHAPLLHLVPEGQDGEFPHMHCPLTQLSAPEPQLTQAPPALPQVVIDAGWQAPLLSQQPLGQKVALHGRVHAPLTHWVPAEHGPPFLPQTHRPLTQLSVNVGSQTTQVLPCDPQSLVLVPDWHTPFASQQP
jgi:hypothetical protein